MQRPAYPTAPLTPPAPQGIGAEAAASVTYAVIDPNGLPCLVTFRAADAASLLDIMGQASATLVGQGYVPDLKGRPYAPASPAPASPAHAPTPGPAAGGGVEVIKGYRVTEPPTCPKHPGVVMVVRTNSKNGERFWTCNQPDPDTGDRFCKGPYQLKHGPY